MVGTLTISSVLIVPEKNEGSSPLKVVEEGLRSRSVDEVYVIDGWSTDDTASILKDALPRLAKRYGKGAELYRSKLRNTGKGGAMVTGMEIGLEEGHSRFVFADGDISSVTSGWFDYMVEGIEGYKADMARGYFDRSPSDAQITRHVTIPAINMFFPEGRGISQPLGGELCMTDTVVRHLLRYPLSPPHTWGIDTFMTVTTLVGGFRIVELYLSQKLHKGKRLRDLENMFLECFDEMAKLIHFHGRDRDVPTLLDPVVTTVPRSESPIERVGRDVRTLAYMDGEAEVDVLFDDIQSREVDLHLLRDLGVLAEDVSAISRALSNRSDFLRESRRIDAPRWVRILDALLRGYIRERFSGRYRDVLYAVWRVRALAFCTNEAIDFESAEESSRRQADLAYELGRSGSQADRQ
jgi:glycosyltransferase involved in cell wall biosynthesis